MREKFSTMVILMLGVTAVGRLSRPELPRGLARVIFAADMRGLARG